MDRGKIKGEIIEYVVVGKEETKAVRISAQGLKKLIEREVKGGLKVADFFTQKATKTRIKEARV